jgi:hypothetical protein
VAPPRRRPLPLLSLALPLALSLPLPLPLLRCRSLFRNRCRAPWPRCLSLPPPPEVRAPMVAPPLTLLPRVAVGAGEVAEAALAWAPPPPASSLPRWAW